MRLTKIDKQILESYKVMLEGLSEYLGPGYEIVLHSLEDYTHAAVKVFNGQHSGRKEGAPITDLALNMLSKIQAGEAPTKSMIYANISPAGERIHACTIPVMGEKQRIIGLVCINFYLSLSLSQFMEQLIHSNTQSDKVKEIFIQNSKGIITREIALAKAEVRNDTTIPTTLKNKKVIEILMKKNIFERKNAVEIVAAQLGISKNTVYLHLRSLKKRAV
jgi:predicted transcriptional regulator YheO